MAESKDSKNSYPQMVARAKQEPNWQIENPFGFKIYGKDIAGLSYNDFKELLAQKAYTEYYEKGKKINKEISFLSNFNLKTYQTVGKILNIFKITVPIFALLTAIFAYGFDKLTSLGEFTVISSAPFVLIYYQILTQLRNAKNGFGSVLKIVLPNIEPIINLYKNLLYVGLAATFVGIIGMIINKYLKYSKSKIANNPKDKK